MNLPLIAHKTDDSVEIIIFNVQLNSGMSSKENPGTSL